MNGRIWLYQGGRLVAHQTNAIESGFRDYMRDRLLSGSYNKSLANLFTTFGLQTDNNGKDGVAFYDENTFVWYAMPTSFVVPPNPRSRRLFAMFVPDNIFTIQHFTLGHDTIDGGIYIAKYASFSLPEPKEFSPNVPVSLIWQIELTRGAFDQSPSPSLSP